LSSDSSYWWEISMPRGTTSAAEIEKLKQDVTGLAQQLGTVVDTTKDEAMEQLRGQLFRVKSTIDDVLAASSEKGQEAADAVKEVADTLGEAVEESLRKRPLTTVGLAIGLGFLFGATWRR